MIIKWYNRDSISDVDMKQAKLVARRLMRRKASPVRNYDDYIKYEDIETETFIDPITTGLVNSLNRALENLATEMECGEEESSG